MSWKTLIIHAQYVVLIPKCVYVHWRVEIFASCLMTIYSPRHDKFKIRIQGKCAHLEVQISNLPNSLDSIMHALLDSSSGTQSPRGSFLSVLMQISCMLFLPSVFTNCYNSCVYS